MNTKASNRFGKVSRHYLKEFTTCFQTSCLRICNAFENVQDVYTHVFDTCLICVFCSTPGSMNRLFSDFLGNSRGSFWGCSGLFGSVWERFWDENWGNIRGENSSEVVNETI